MDAGQVIEVGLSSPFCFTSKVLGWENVLCGKMAPVLPITMFFVVAFFFFLAFHQRRLVKSPDLSNLYSIGPKYTDGTVQKEFSRLIAVCMQGKVLP